MRSPKQSRFASDSLLGEWGQNQNCPLDEFYDLCRIAAITWNGPHQEIGNVPPIPLRTVAGCPRVGRSTGERGMTTPIKIQTKVRFDRVRKGRKVLMLGAAAQPEVRGRIPRVTRLLALAHRFEKLIADGDVRDYADLARLGHVTRARLSQIMDLLLLAPDIQEEILFLSAVEAGEDPIHERQLRRIVATTDWRKQRRAWRRRELAAAQDVME